MTEIIIISTLIIAISLAFLCIKLFLHPNGSFTSMHIHDSEAMRQRGIHCVMDQDREMRTRSRFAVKERGKEIED